MIEQNKLLKAILNKSRTQVEDCIISEGPDIYYKDEHDRTYLHLCVHLRAKELVQYFLEEGIHPNDGDKDRVTALHRACRVGDGDIVKLLLDHGANPEKDAIDSIQPLHVAAAFGHSDCIRVLRAFKNQNGFRGGIDIDCRDDQSHTALHYAAAEGHTQVVMLLIKLGCHVNADNIAANKPLHFAAAAENPELCRLLIKSSADPDAQNLKGQTALHIATHQACPKTVLVLLESQADPNIRDNEGNTCAHLALRAGHIDILRILMMDSRTDPSVSDNEQDTVIHVALKLGHHNLIDNMLMGARDLTKQNATGCSVIIEAIKFQLEDLALKMLKKCPSLVHTATHDLVTPLHLAAERGMRTLTGQLLIAGAQVDATDANGLTPSLYCAKNDSVMECLAMIEDIMMITENNDENSQGQQQTQVKGGKPSSRISS